ncbi:MAG: hypothetical protein K6B52_01555 [Clostridiales bacterium]|nr:hypothetical protein [Clostridiales bacterium]
MKKSLTLFAAVMLVCALVFSFAGCSYDEEETAETTTIFVKSPLPTDITTSYDEESNVVTDTTYSPEALAANSVPIFEYFNLHINEAKQGKASADMSLRRSLGKVTDENGESLPISENKYVNAAFSLLDSYMLHNGGDSAEYGEDLSSFMPIKGESYVSRLTMDEIELATCADNGTERRITVTLKTPALPETIEKAYDMENIDDILEEFKKANKYMSLDKPVISYDNCQVILTTNVETDEVTAIEYIKNIDVKINVTGEGKMSEISTVPVQFRLTNTVSYSLNHEEPTTLADK